LKANGHIVENREYAQGGGLAHVEKCGTFGSGDAMS
jgi:hypothetical protein